MRVLEEGGVELVATIRIEHGLKVDVRDFVLKELKGDPDIQRQFKLNVRRLNRWWHSVYFEEKTNVSSHDIKAKNI